MSRKFRTCLDKGDFTSVPGLPDDIEYSARYDDSGVLVLDIVGKREVYKDIQAYADSVDIYKIMQRYQAGETDVLNRVQGFYDDVSGLPKTYQDVLNSVIKTEQFFDSLPVEKKHLFNDSFTEFMVALGEPDFIDKYFKSDVPVPPFDADSKEDVIENES